MSTPATLPADFNGWDEAKPSASPATLPAGFKGWDTPKPPATSSAPKPTLTAHPPDELAAREFAREGLPAASSPGATPVPKQLQPGTGLPYEQTNNLLNTWRTPDEQVQSDAPRGPQRKNWAFEMGEEPETAQGSIAISGVEGYPEMYHGAKDLAHANNRDQRYRAGTELIGGAMTAATPALIAEGGNAPGPTLRALGTAMIGGKVARYLTQKAGGSSAAQNFAEAAGSLIPGAAEMGAEAAGRLRAEQLLPKPATFAPDSTPALPGGGAPPHALPPASTPFDGSRFAARPDGSTVDLAVTPDAVNPGPRALPTRSVRALPPAAEVPATAPAKTIPTLMPQSNQLPGIDGEQAVLKTASADLPVRYRVVEAGQLQPSHNPGTFAPMPGYPEGVQERAYHSSPEAQARVIEQAQDYDPSFTVNSNPDATNGPPIVTPDGIVLGGNSRAMSTTRLYASGKGDVYRQALERQAAQFGIDPEALKEFHSPVLVREVPRIATTEEARRIASDLNRNFTGALDANELAVSRGRSVSPATLDQVQQGLDHLGENASLADLLREDPVPIVSALQRDGVITDRERPQFLTKAGGLNEAGRAFVQRTLLGAVVPDVSVLDSAPPSMLGKIAGSLGDLARLRARGDAWDITAPLTEALRERAIMAARGLNTDTYLGQSNLYGGGPSPVVAALVRALDMKPRAFRAAVHAFTRDANEDVAQQGRLVGIPKPDPVEAFNHAFGASVTPEELRRAGEPVDAMLSITRMPPWALTRQEYLGELADQLEQRLQEAKGRSRRAQQFRQQAADAIGEMREGRDPHFLLDRHEMAVRKAVESGKPVPERVRREYPDFGGSVSPSLLGRGPLGPMISAQWVPHESGPGTIRIDRQGFSVLRALLLDGRLPKSYEEFGGLSLSRPAAERLLVRIQEEKAEAPPREAAYIGAVGNQLKFAMMRPHPGGVAFVKIGDEPETLRRREIEEHAHLLQRDLGSGNAIQHLPPKAIDELSSLPAFKTAVRSLKGRYTQVPIGGEDRQALYVAEAGAKLLAGDFEDLGLSEKAGQRARTAYVQKLEDNYGERLTEAARRAHPEIRRILTGAPGWNDVAGWDARDLRTEAGASTGGPDTGRAERTGVVHPPPDRRTGADQTKLSLVPLSGKARVLRELALALEAGDVAQATRAVDLARSNGIALDPAHVRSYLALLDKAGRPAVPSTPFPVITGGRAPGETPTPSGLLALVPKPAPQAPEPPLWQQTRSEVLQRLGRPSDAPHDFGYHEAAVRDALLRGLPVPVRVLDQYPNLLKVQKQTAGHVLPFPTRRIQPVTHGDGDALARIELAQPLKALDAALSKYGGVSPEARAAFKSFEGMRDFRAVEASRLAESLYGSVKRLLDVKTYADALPHLLKIQRAIARPNDPRFQLTQAESRVRDLLMKLRDRITQHDLQRGWLTPQQAAARPNYWPGDYTDDIADIARAMKGKGAAGSPSMRPEPENYRGRKFDDFVDGEASGLHQNPDAVAVLLRRLDRSLQAGNAQDLLHRLSQLGPEEVQQPTTIQYRGRTVPVVPLGYTLASDLPAIRSSLALRELGGDLAVSDRVAGALERVLGTAPEKASRITRFRRAAWSLQRALSFWNLLKHPENVSANAAMTGWTRATKSLVHGNIHGAISDAKIAASPLGFLLDRDVMDGALHQKGKLYDRALKAGAIRSSVGRSLTSFGGGSEVPRLDAVLDEARRSVFGSQGEPLGHRVGRYLGTATNLGHHLVFSFFDTGVRLEMFRQLTSQGLSDEKAAAAVNDALVDYGDVKNTGAAGVLNHVAYTLPWTKGSLKAQALMFRENPIAWTLATGAVLGALEWANRKRTGHGMTSNPPGMQDRAAVAPPDSKGNLRYERATLPWLSWEQLMLHPAEFGWNRLDPNLRTVISAATNESYPPSVLPNPVTGEAGRRYPVVNDTERAAASAGHPKGMLSSLGRIAARNMLQSPASDLGRVRSGKLPASELLLPISGRTDDPYRDFRNSAGDARRIASSVTLRLEQGEPADDLQASLRPSLKRAEADLARAVEQFQRRPPTAAADRSKAEQAIHTGYRELEASRKAFVLAELAAAIRSDDASRAEAAAAFARTNGVELNEADVARLSRIAAPAAIASPAIGGHR